ncbi:hypothetical protein PC129_g14660 [Phytophthora cactorum]|uniref:Uncharacterized protein n=2 Tax=Phytophthora cactorum TaxID=29920 RepID=A0A8T1HQL6_9STRA|nr:hypothetical protein PC118_g17753 [Phytophthora cactorum]KAG2999590.1 hypothetical protein PC119_g17166 [Phytophthora cactorum]KAG3214421.1 hypothetical protein PC129_g14660 [Phytophthora cactorum]
MVYSKSESERQGQADEFKTLACHGGRMELWGYFETNSMRSKMWTGEFFAKLKADLDSSMNMKKCLDSVIRYQRRKEDEYVTRAIMPCTQRNIIYGEEMNQFLGMTSEWLADVFLSEYTYAVNPEAIKR